MEEFRSCRRSADQPLRILCTVDFVDGAFESNRRAGLDKKSPRMFAVWIKEGQECTLVTMKRLSIVCAMLALAVNVVRAESALSATASAPRFKVLALAESRGHHVEFTKAAKPWLRKFGDENGFEVDYITNTTSIAEAFLARYQLVLQ